MTATITSTFSCDTCGGEAATLSLVRSGGGEGATLHCRGFIGETQERVTESAAAALEAALKNEDVRAVYALDPLWAPFYCPSCDRCYCSDHWLVVPAFDEDFPGWYDVSYGTCPQGHRRLVDD